MQDTFLRIEIKNREPVELLDLTASMQALGQQFIRYAFDTGVHARESDVRLYIQEIRSGSILADLVSIAQQGSFILSDLQLLGGFAKSLKESYDYFAGASSIDPPLLKHSDLRQISKIIEPVAKDNGSQYNFNVNDHGKVVLQFGYNSLEANAIQNRISREISLSPGNATETVFERETLYFRQARDDVKSQTGDKGIIERFSTRPVKLLFASENIKNDILNLKDNIFHKAFIVDGKVHIAEGKPVAYTIYKIHEIVDRDR